MSRNWISKKIRVIFSREILVEQTYELELLVLESNFSF